MGIKSKLLISYLLLIVLSVSVLSFFISNKSQEIVFKEVTEKSERTTELITDVATLRNRNLSEKIKTDLYFSEELLNNLGKLRIDKSQLVTIGDINVPTLYAGNTKLSLDNTLVDNIKNYTGEIVIYILIRR